MRKFMLGVAAATLLLFGRDELDLVLLVASLFALFLLALSVLVVVVVIGRTRRAGLADLSSRPSGSLCRAQLRLYLV